MKLYKMIEIYLKYDNIHTFGVINAFICINNHVNSCINSMLSAMHSGRTGIVGPSIKAQQTTQRALALPTYIPDNFPLFLPCETNISP